MRTYFGLSTSKILLIAVVVVTLALVSIWMARRASDSPSPPPQVVLNESRKQAKPLQNTPTGPFGIPPAAMPPTEAPRNAPPTSPMAGAQTFDSFRQRPFAVTKANGANAWTGEDGMSPTVIRQLAHNELEAKRLLEENPRIKRRQLVYRSETVPMLLERAGNQPLQSFTLPAMDGQEIEVEVTGTPVVNGRSGSVMGRVKGDPNSMVSVGFSNGNESFNVISPEKGLFLVADAREPGEVMVKEIDPNVYSPPAGNTPDYILTNDPIPGKKSPPASPSASPQ